MLASWWFNNLLTIIKGYNQLSLLELKEGSDLRGNIEEALKAADRAADLTRQLLAFGRRQVMEMKIFDLNEILQNMNKMLTRILGEDIEVKNIFAENLGRVKVDQGQMEQVVLNLVVNARDAMPNGRKLIIETANVELDEVYARNHIAVKPGRYVMLSVTDTGRGMTPEIRDRVFEPFFTTKEKGKGTGLGLSTVYGIVKQSGGNIWGYSEPGHGTTFKIYLSRVDQPLEILQENGVNGEVPRGNETVLVVEDEESVLKITVRILEKQGYTAFGVSRWDEALKLFKQKKEKIHLVLVDVVLPEMNGPKLVEKLREIRQGFKVIYMSGYTEDTVVLNGALEKGATFLQKPFTFGGLAKKVRKVLDS
jgi:CheY-like chemotaxis protein